MLRRHPILTAVAATLLLLIGVVTVFLARFDLDDYRGDLEATLSAALERPVRLGHARYALHGGLALEFEQVRIGEDPNDGLLEARRLALRLELLPLLRGRFDFDRLDLEEPTLLLVFGPDQPEAPPSPRRMLRQVEEAARATLIRKLTIRQGTLRIDDRREPRQPRRLEVDQIDLTFTDLGLDVPVQLQGKGRFAPATAAAQLSLSGSVILPAVPEAWRETTLDLRLTLDRMQPGPLLHDWLGAEAGIDTRGSCSLRLDLAGTPARGVNISAALDGEQFTLVLPRWYREALPLSKLRLTAIWTATAASHRLGAVAADLDGIGVVASLTLPAAPSAPDAPPTEVSLRLRDLPLTRLVPFFPDHLAPQLATLLRGRLRDGTLEHLDLALAWPAPDFPPPPPEPLEPLRTGSFRVRGVALELPRVGLARDMTLDGRWQDGALILQNGSGQLDAGSFAFGGEVRLDSAGIPQLALQSSGRLDGAGALLLLPLPAGSRLVAAGHAPFEFAVRGTTRHLSATLSADLRELGISLYGETLKAGNDPGELFTVADLIDGNLELGYARLTIPAGEVGINGHIAIGEPYAYRFTFDVAGLDLGALTRHNGTARLLRLHGEGNLHYEIAGSAAGVTRRSGVLGVRNLGLHFAGVVADLSQASGRIRLEPERFVIEQASGRLGSSTLSGSGSIDQLDSAPRVTLDFRGESVLAADLVFHSSQRRISELTGRLVIDGHGIIFKEIRARLPGGTRAVVSGELHGYKPAHLDLDVDAEQVDVAEVVALWDHPAPTSPPVATTPTAGNGGFTLRLNAEAQQGDLYGLPFRNGRGTISYQNGRLVGHPVSLQTGTGSYTGQLVLRELTGTPLLAISGHVADVDASAVYNQLLGRPGLVSGNLGGDFHIEGRLGSSYLPTSLGSFSLRIDRGVLRQFPVLSKVFSILNVSQIFTLKLPDMAEEGMPFKQLRATFNLRGGILHTEDLVVDSDAMNLAAVGDINLRQGNLDLVLAVRPLATVDKVVSSIPLAGWILTGQEKALVTAQFRITGNGDQPRVEAIPITSLSDTMIGIFKRTFGLPGKMIGDLQDFVSGDKK